MYRLDCEIEGITEMIQDRPWDLEESLKGQKPAQTAVGKYTPNQLYLDDEGYCCIPTRHIKGAMKYGAKKVKLGRANIVQTVKACVHPTKRMVRIISAYGSELKEPEFIDENLFQKKDGKQQYKERPGFRSGWKVRFTLECIDKSLTKQKIEECLEWAGSLYGVGTRRPDYGRFKVVKCKEI